MLIYELLNDIKGEKYRGFISYCLEHSTYFSLTFHQEKEKKCTLTQELNPYIYKKYETYSWYCYRTYEKPLYIKLFHSNIALTDTLVKHFGRMFHNKTDGIEDICFFYNESLMFCSVTHEYIGNLLLPDENELVYFQKFAKWDKYNITPRDYEFYPDFKKFL